MSQARNEIWTVKKEIKHQVTKTKKVMETTEIKIEAFSDDYYVNLAKQEIALEYRNACKNLALG